MSCDLTRKLKIHESLITESRNAHCNLTRKLTFRPKCLDFFKNSVFWFRKTGGGHWMTGWDICRTLWFDEKIHVLTDMSITKMVSLNSSDSEKLVVVIDMFWNLPLNPELIHVLTEMSINLFIRSNTWIYQSWIYFTNFATQDYISKGFRVKFINKSEFSQGHVNLKLHT